MSRSHLLSVLVVVVLVAAAVVVSLYAGGDTRLAAGVSGDAGAYVSLPPLAKGWEIVDLGTLPGYTDSIGQALDSSGQVAGTAQVNKAGALGSDFHQQAFLWSQGRLIPLGAQPQEATVAALNDHGLAVGDDGSRAVLFRSGKMIHLTGLGRGHSRANAVNARGQVVGEVELGRNEARAFLWSNGHLRLLGTLGGRRSTASAINNRGWVVGSSTTKSGQVHAFLWKGKRLIDLDRAADPYAQARAVNARGQVLVNVSTALGNPLRTFVWQAGRRRLLPLYRHEASIGVGLNARGHVLLELTSSLGDPQRAVLIAGGKAVDIGSFGALTEAVALNDRDQAIGLSGTPDHRKLPFIWIKGKMLRLPLLEDEGLPPTASVTALNEQGWALGSDYETVKGKTRLHAVLWRQR